MIHVDSKGHTQGKPFESLGCGVGCVARVGKRTEWKGWTQGRRRNYQWEQGNVTFVPFVSFGCSRNVRQPAALPAVRSLGRCGVELGPWHWVGAVIFPPPHPHVQRGAMEENEHQGGFNGEQ